MLDDWRLLLTVPADDVTASDVVSFSADGRSLLAITPVEANTSRLIRVDVTSGDIEVLATDPEADVDGVVLHPDTREPQIVTVMKDRTEYRVLDRSVRGGPGGDPGAAPRRPVDRRPRARRTRPGRSRSTTTRAA